MAKDTNAPLLHGSQPTDSAPDRRHIEVAAAIIHHQGRILATQRGYGNYKGFWEFPGGKMEPGETMQQTLRRELREEMEADVVIERLFDDVEWDYPEFHLTMHCLLCTLTDGRYTLLEHSDARWLSMDELLSVKWLPADFGTLEKIRLLFTK